MSASLLSELIPSANLAFDVASQISTNASVMARMISDLLDYTRTRFGAGIPVVAAKMDLGVLWQEVYHEFRTAYPESQMNFHTQGDLTADWDSDRLRQAISTLVGNAIQYSPDSPPVEIIVMRDISQVIIVVDNGGPPIPPGELPKIFDPRVRGSSAEHPKANRPPSIGLGLYIARAITESHGGSIDVTSSVEEGTSFTVKWPREATAHSGQPVQDEKHLQSV